MKKPIVIITFFLLFISCQKKEQPILSFYYWKTIYKLSQNEKKCLKNNNVKKLYVRYFDIDIDKKTHQPFPKSAIKFEQNTSGFKIVPVIFVKNQVLLDEKLSLDDLVFNAVSFIEQINSKNKISIKEIQIDCDWTLQSKENYLAFINLIKKVSHKKISATIRLHQIKYSKKTGVPNVDNAILMYYNMGTIATDASNSIYDKRLADKYLQSIKNYPLHLNVAIPYYSWVIHISNNKVVGLISKVDRESIEKDTNFVKINNRFFKTLYSNYKSGTFFKKNDILKFESVSKDNLLEIASDLQENLKQSPNEILFYDLDEFNSKQYEKDIFKQVIDRF